MDIYIVFDKINISIISGKEESLKKEICKHASLFNKKKAFFAEGPKVNLFEGKPYNSTKDSKISIFIVSEGINNDMGQQIVDFKKRTMGTFKEYGIPLTKQELLITANSSLNIGSLINKNEKTGVIAESKNNYNEEFDYEQKSKQYIPVEPLYSFERVILPEDVKGKIEEAIGILECENKVFNEWGLYEIQPHPATSLSFYGPSGTGKTMAAEAIAKKLGKKILKVSYADVESKYHGEGPKMVKAIFLAAKREGAVLFFDEADSLLSKRLTNVSDGSAQAINSMRSQLLICLEEFRGIVIFATNLVINYDKAFLTRLISVEFKNPDVKTRKIIWDVHIKPLKDDKPHQLNIPLDKDVKTESLAQKYEFVGREIRNAVVSACVSVALAKRDIVKQDDFVNACEKIIKEKKALAEASDTNQVPDIIKKAITEKIRKKEKEKKDDVPVLDK